MGKLKIPHKVSLMALCWNESEINKENEPETRATTNQVDRRRLDGSRRLRRSNHAKLVGVGNEPLFNNIECRLGDI